MSTAPREDVEAVVASLVDAERTGKSVAEIARSWRFAGIADPSEVRAWLEVGVFDGHRAGLLKMAGVEPHVVAALPNASKLGLAFALGELSLAEMKNLIALLDDRSVDSNGGQTTHVRTRKRT